MSFSTSRREVLDASTGLLSQRRTRAGHILVIMIGHPGRYFSTLIPCVKSAPIQNLRTFTVADSQRQSLGEQPSLSLSLLDSEGPARRPIISSSDSMAVAETCVNTVAERVCGAMTLTATYGCLLTLFHCFDACD